MFKSMQGLVAIHVVLFALFVNLVFASSSPTPFPYEPRALVRRVEPQFPDSPPTCPQCAQNYSSISSCVQAAPVLANISMVLFNPGAFIDVIKCACTDTFQAVFPICADCFIATNQTDVLNTQDLPGLVDNIRKVCSFASIVLSNKTSTAIPTPTQSSEATILSSFDATVVAITCHSCGCACDNDKVSHNCKKGWSLTIPNPLKYQMSRAPLSAYSSPAVPHSGWASINFLLGAGMVVIQPSTDKIVIVHEPSKKSYFLPRGRKDIGESLEQTALREAYEESGYRVEFLPLYTYSQAPSSPQDPNADLRPNTEPIYTTVTSYKPRIRRGVMKRLGGEYIVSWFVGQIPEDAVRELGTGMPDEQEYQSHLVSAQQAYDLLCPDEAQIFKYAWDLYLHTKGIEAERSNEAALVNENSRNTHA